MIKSSLTYDAVGILSKDTEVEHTWNFMTPDYTAYPVDQAVLDIDFDPELELPLISVELFVPDPTEHFFHFVSKLPPEAVGEIMSIITKYSPDFKRDI